MPGYLVTEKKQVAWTRSTAVKQIDSTVATNVTVTKLLRLK